MSRYLTKTFTLLIKLRLALTLEGFIERFYFLDSKSKFSQENRAIEA